MKSVPAMLGIALAFLTASAQAQVTVKIAQVSPLTGELAHI
ncbi:MAG: hypothetical protein ACTHKH_04615 [Trinickia sp.]